MNIRELGPVLIGCGVAIAIFVLVMLLAEGCGPPALPAEPPFVETVAINRRD